MAAMLAARLYCSNPACAAGALAEGRLPELDSLSCECGCGLAVIAWPDRVEIEGVRAVPGAAPPLARRCLTQREVTARMADTSSRSSSALVRIASARPAKVGASVARENPE